jgi:hypothetical protein
MNLNEVFRTYYEAPIKKKRENDTFFSLVHLNSYPSCKNVEMPIKREDEQNIFKEFWGQFRYRVFACSFCNAVWSSGTKNTDERIKETYQFEN